MDGDGLMSVGSVGGMRNLINGGRRERKLTNVDERSKVSGVHIQGSHRY